MKRIWLLAGLIPLMLISCQEDDLFINVAPEEPVDNFQASAGSANFSTYVALGNSITAGFSDNALFIDGQETSYANFLGNAFGEAGGGDFSTPLMADNLGGLTLGGQVIAGNRLILSFTTGSPTPVAVPGNPATEVTNKLTGGVNNMGVPGAKSYHIAAPGYGSVAGVAQGLANPYFARFSSSETATILEDALAQSPTFFTIWLGNNDVLGYAASGGAGVNQAGNLDPSTYGGNDISDPNVVGGALTAAITAMKAQGAQGVIANIPGILDVPYFTTVPFNPVPLDEATAQVVNGAYAAYNGGLQQALAANLIDQAEFDRRVISFQAGPGNAPVILDEDLTDLTFINPALINMRQATAEDKIVLPASSFIGTLANPNDPTSVNGVGVPLADNWVLTPEEQTEVENARLAMNQVIAAVAANTDTPLVDIDALYQSLLTTGVLLDDGSLLNNDFGTGGAFSLDGIHPTPRAHAVVANEFISVIEDNFGAELRELNPLSYTGLYIQ